MSSLEVSARERMRRLGQSLHNHDTLALSFSGGVDSAFLLKAAADALGPDRVLAVTVRAGNFPDREFREAEALARDLGVRQVVVDLDPLTVPGFAENGPDRCYHCKKAILLAVRQQAEAAGIKTVADGANADDLGDYRPGRRAAAECGAISPLAEVGMTKAEIRLLSRQLGLPSWDKPSFACLATRIPYGEPVTAQALAQIDQAEAYLLALGFREVRVRRHGQLARIEVGREERARFVREGLMDQIDARLRELGFLHVALDLGGYRTGSMNAALEERDKNSTE